MFNEREKLILQILLKNIGEALSIKEIAKATKIKERTLYREIKNLALLPLIDSYSIDTELCDFLFETGSVYKKCS